MSVALHTEPLDALSVLHALPGNHLVLLPDGPEFTIAAVTDSYLRATYSSREDLIGKGVVKVFPSDPSNKDGTDIIKIIESFNYVLHNRSAHRMEDHRYDIKNPVTGQYELKIWRPLNSPVLNAAGEVQYIVHTIEDVTDQVKARLSRDATDRKLVETENRFRNMVQQAPVPITLTRGLDLIVESINRPMLQLFNKATEEDVLGKKLEEILPEVKDQPVLDIIRQVVRTGEGFKGDEISVELMRDGKLQTHYFNLSYTPVYEEGELTGVLHVAIDLTEQVESKRKLQENELKYRSLFRSMDLGFCILEMLYDEAGRAIDYGFIEINHVFESQTGLTDAVGKNVSELVPDLERHWIDNYDEVVKTGKAKRFIEQSEAMHRWFDVYAFPVNNDKNNQVALLFRDITDARNAEDMVKQTEENFRSMVQQAPVAMCVLLGSDFIVDVVNQEMLELWGKQSQDILQKPVLEALSDLKDGDLQRVLQHVYNTGKAYFAAEQQVKLVRDGKEEIKFINYVYEPYRRVGGEVFGILAIAVDVTEQITARKKIERNREEVEMAVAVANLGTFTVDIPTNTVHYSQRVRDWFGFEEETPGLDTLSKHIHPEDREELLAAIKASIVSEEKSNHDVICRVLNPKDEVERHLHSLGKTYFDENGQPQFIVGMIQDITDGVLFEQQLRQNEHDLQLRVEDRTRQLQEQKNLLDSILQNSSNGISVTEMQRDEQGKVIDARTILANDAAVKYTGLPREVYLSKTATELDPGILTTPYGQACLRTLETGEPSLMQYYLAVSGKWLELTISRLDEEHLIHIFTDISPMKEAQLQLEKTVEDLRHSNTSLGEFAYAASHDLKEPVRKIHVFAERLANSLQDRMTKEESHFFGRMKLAARRMSNLIDDLLTFSEFNEKSVLDEQVDLNNLVQQVLTDLDLEIEQKAASITVGELFTVQGHRRQLQQALHNLLSNALKYHKQDEPPRVTVDARLVTGQDVPVQMTMEESGKTFHLLAIRDEGIGFNQEDADKIFNVFTRLHGMAEYKGTGIGLAIVRRVSQNHNGYCWAESTPGEGSTFYLLLPAGEDNR